AGSSGRTFGLRRNRIDAGQWDKKRSHGREFIIGQALRRGMLKPRTSPWDHFRRIWRAPWLVDVRLSLDSASRASPLERAPISAMNTMRVRGTPDAGVPAGARVAQFFDKPFKQQRHRRISAFPRLGMPESYEPPWKTRGRRECRVLGRTHSLMCKVREHM